MSKEQIWFELIKLAIQAIGAIFVARLAVRWALSRYKEEKTWERQLAAYVDVCAALGEMRMIVGKWAEQIEGRPYNDEFLKKMNERYRSAKTNLENTVAVASLILPRETYHLLSKLETDIEKIDPQDDPWDAYHQEYGLIDDALTDLIKQGREALGFPVHALDKKAWRKVQKSLESKLPD